MQQTQGAYRTSAKSPPADPVAIVIAEVVLVVAVASYGAALDLVNFFRSRHGRMATLVIVLTTVMAAYQLWDLGYENRQLQAQVTERESQITELQAEREQLINENRGLSWRANSLDEQLSYETSRAEHLLTRLFVETVPVPVNGNDTSVIVMDGWGVVCHVTDLLGPEGTCP